MPHGKVQPAEGAVVEREEPEDDICEGCSERRMVVQCTECDEVSVSSYSHLKPHLHLAGHHHLAHPS
jgi:hypothetical protein